MHISSEQQVERAELIELYDSVGWSAYTRSPDDLVRAIANSDLVVTARDGAGSLIGLARCLSDDVSILYLQDILVHPDHQGTGVGRRLLEVCLDRYAHVRQKVLLTDGDEAQRRLYEGAGYRHTTDLEGTPLEAYVRIDG